MASSDGKFWKGMAKLNADDADRDADMQDYLEKNILSICVEACVICVEFPST
jgi:hypothetical protein